MQYYDLRKHWTKKIVPHLNDSELNRVLVADFRLYSSWPFQKGDYPEWCDGCDWRLSHKGKEPRFWKYVCSGACHWLCNFSLRLAMLVEPDRKWRIVTSRKHSTVWDGKETLFDFNFQAFDIPADDCFAEAKGRVMPIGRYRQAGTPCWLFEKMKRSSAPNWIVKLRKERK